MATPSHPVHVPLGGRHSTGRVKEEHEHRTVVWKWECGNVAWCLLGQLAAGVVLVWSPCSLLPSRSAPVHLQTGTSLVLCLLWNPQPGQAICAFLGHTDGNGERLQKVLREQYYMLLNIKMQPKCGFGKRGWAFCLRPCFLNSPASPGEELPVSFKISLGGCKLAQL